MRSIMMNIAIGICAIFLVFVTYVASAKTPMTYEVGQVWAYNTRAGEHQSRLKIQKIELLSGSDEKVYHISVININISGPYPQKELPHLPVSEKTLNSSVTALQSGTYDFPSPDEGIAIWKENEGGVFDIPVSEIIAITEQSLS